MVEKNSISKERLSHKAKQRANTQRTLFDMLQPKQAILPNEISTIIPCTTRKLGSAAVTSSLATAVDEQLNTKSDIEQAPPNYHEDIMTTSANALELISCPAAVSVTADEETANSPQTPLSNHTELPEEGKSRRKPIVIDVSPVQFITHSSKPSPPVYSLFVPKSTLPSRVASKVSHNFATLDPPLPDTDSQHIKGNETCFEIPTSPFPRRQKKTDKISGLLDSKAEPKASNDMTRMTWTSDLVTIRSPAILHTHFETASKMQTSTPLASERFPILSTPSSRPWTDKWHPRSAEEVLGNETSAVYLRDWLCALQLQFQKSSGDNSTTEVKIKATVNKSKTSMKGLKRPRIVRAVSKKGRKKQKLYSSDEDDSWIVDDDDETIYSDEDIRSPSFHPSSMQAIEQPSSTTSRPPKQHVFEQLHNTILLTGPSGSGKTACVYACAEQLGWVVFEVYPGIGKRSGANVQQLIGEVGKNHLVQTEKRHVGLGTSNTCSDSFTSFTTDTNCSKSGDSDIQAFRQSIILLEEVDILYREDISFWPAVIELIKNCKRPVICTCNDPSLVPTSVLPLQTILTFHPCPAPVAVEYLKSLCSAEGYSVSDDALYQLYTEAYHYLPQDIFHAILTEKWPAPDLRRTINTLQFLCSTLTENTRPGFRSGWEREPRSLESVTNGLSQDSSPDDQNYGSAGENNTRKTSIPISNPSLEALANHTEFISYWDTEPKRQSDKSPVAMNLAATGPTTDDEIGHTILFDSLRWVDIHPGFSDQVDEISSFAHQYARGTGPQWPAFHLESFRDIGSACTNFKAHVDRLLREVCPCPVWLSPRWSHYMDYVPWIRHLVAAEDLQEILHNSRERPGGRTTRNSSGYTRVLELTGDGKEALMQTAFGGI